MPTNDKPPYKNLFFYDFGSLLDQNIACLYSLRLWAIYFAFARLCQIMLINLLILKSLTMKYFGFISLTQSEVSYEVACVVCSTVYCEAASIMITSTVMLVQVFSILNLQ